MLFKMYGVIRIFKFYHSTPFLQLMLQDDYQTGLPSRSLDWYQAQIGTNDCYYNSHKVPILPFQLDRHNTDTIRTLTLREKLRCC